MKLFSRAFLRELYASAGGVFTALFTIILTTVLVRLLGQATSGKIGADAILMLIVYASLQYLPTILILAAFVAVLSTLTRWYRDSEMVVWFACGLSQRALLRPIFVFLLPIALIAGGLSLFLTPWAFERSNEYRRYFEQRSDLLRISPGQFVESAKNNRVFFVESTSEADNRVKNIFAQLQKEDKTSIVVSASGYIDIKPNGDKFLVLLNGRRYDGKLGQADYKMMEFDQYEILVDNKRKDQSVDRSERELSSWALISNPNPKNLSEFFWRISLPLMMFVLAILAIPLSYVNPRVGRSVNVVIALLLFFIYLQSINIVQSWIAKGKWSFYGVWWIPHLLMLLIAIYLFWQKGRRHLPSLWKQLQKRKCS